MTEYQLALGSVGEKYASGVVKMVNDPGWHIEYTTVEDIIKWTGMRRPAAQRFLSTMKLALSSARRPSNERPQVKNSREAFKLLQPMMVGLPHEEGWVIHLNTSMKMINMEKHSEGATNMTVMDRRKLLHRALLCNAQSIVIAHNHPSGQLSPSLEDVRVTKEVRQACLAMGLELSDHMIVTDNAYYSFADNGDLH